METIQDEPEISEPIYSECRYCGCEYEGEGEDCGACRLDAEQCADYVRAGTER